MEVDLSPLLKAATENSGRLESLITATPNHEILRLDFRGLQLIHHAAALGNRAAIDLLIQKGADINALTIPMSVSPLSFAVENSDFETVQHLGALSLFAPVCPVRSCASLPFLFDLF